MATTMVSISDKQMDRLKEIIRESEKEFFDYVNYKPPVKKKWLGLITEEDWSKRPELKWHYWDYWFYSYSITRGSAAKRAEGIFESAWRIQNENPHTGYR